MWLLRIIHFNKTNVYAWQKIKDAYGQVAEKKLRSLHHSYRWLIASFVLVLIAVVLFAFLPLPPAGPTPIMIVTPTPKP